MKNLSSGSSERQRDAKAAFGSRQISVPRSLPENAGSPLRGSKIWDVFRKIWMPSAKRRRKLALDNLRRQSASIGYTLDDLTDAHIEAAVTRGKGNIENFPPFTGKTLYWALRRISPDVRELRRRRTKQV